VVDDRDERPAASSAAAGDRLIDAKRTSDQRRYNAAGIAVPARDPRDQVLIRRMFANNQRHIQFEVWKGLKIAGAVIAGRRDVENCETLRLPAVRGADGYLQRQRHAESGRWINSV
jgi:hypothetical protein